MLHRGGRKEVEEGIAESKLRQRAPGSRGKRPQAQIRAGREGAGQNSAGQNSAGGVQALSTRSHRRRILADYRRKRETTCAAIETLARKEVRLDEHRIIREARRI